MISKSRDIPTPRTNTISTQSLRFGNIGLLRTIVLYNCLLFTFKTNLVQVYICLNTDHELFGGSAKSIYVIIQICSSFNLYSTVHNNPKTRLKIQITHFNKF